MTVIQKVHCIILYDLCTNRMESESDFTLIVTIKFLCFNHSDKLDLTVQLLNFRSVVAHMHGYVLYLAQAGFIYAHRRDYVS